MIRIPLSCKRCYKSYALHNTQQECYLVRRMMCKLYPEVHNVHLRHKKEVGSYKSTNAHYTALFCDTI
jgi:Fe-S-cluster containining protein